MKTVSEHMLGCTYGARSFPCSVILHSMPSARTDSPTRNTPGNNGLPFQQWILDTYLHPYDQDWLNY